METRPVKKWKLCAVMVTVFLVLATFAVFTQTAPQMAHAAAGVPDTSWYFGNESAVLYEITTADQLAGLAQLVNAGTQDFSDKTITLGGNIDLSGYADGAGWTPIGTGSTRAFRGVFDGGGYTISGLTANRFGANAQDPLRNVRGGLFGYLYTATVKNLTLTGVDLLGYDYVGGITGDLNGGSISNCRVEGTILGRERVAGIAASTQAGASITDCSFSGNVGMAPQTSASDYVGGIAGFFFNSNIVRCYTEGTVSGRNRVGGIAGYCSSGAAAVYITDCYSTANVSGTNYVGGIVGSVNLGQTPAANPSPLDNTNFVLSRTYSTGSVTATGNYAGGIAGWLKGTVQGSAALNDGIECASADVGRVAGYIDPASTLSNNKAFSGMGSGGGTPFPGGVNTASDLGGADIDATQIGADGTVGGLFTLNGTPYYSEAGRLPTFVAGGMTMPPHLIPKVITAAMFNGLSAVTYTGNPHTPAVTPSGIEPKVTFTVSYTNNINSGTEAKAVLTGMGNYGGEVTLYFTINKADAPYSVPSGLTAVYGQTLNNVALPSTGGGAWAWNNSNTPVGNAGTNAFPATFTSTNSNYNPVTVNVPVIVTRQPVAKPTIRTGLIYTLGEVQDGIVFDSASLAYGYSGKVSAENQGNHTAIFTLNSNYMWSDGTIGTLTLNWTISIGTGVAEMDMAGMEGLVYDGTPKGAPGIKNATGDWNKRTYEYTTDVSGSPAAVWTTAVPVNAGTYWIRAVLTESVSGNFADFTTAAEQYEIEKATPTYTIPTGISGVYSPTLTYGSFTSQLPFEQNVFRWAWRDGQYTQIGGNAGPRTFYVSYIPLGAYADNYKQVDNIPIEVYIQKATTQFTPRAAINGAGSGNIYTGNPIMGVSNATSTAQYTFFNDGNPNCRYTATDKGDYYAIFKLNDPVNYMWANGTSTDLYVYWSIWETQGSAEIIISDFTYNGSPASPRINETTGSWDKVTYEYRINGVWTPVTSHPVNAGTYTVRAVLTNSTLGNYADYLTAEKTYTISPKPLSNELQPVSGTFTYNGAAHTPAAIVTGLVLGADYTVSYANNINAGNAATVLKPTLTITGTGNYTGSVSVSFTIAPKDITEAMFAPIAPVTYTCDKLYPAVISSGSEPYVTFTVEYDNNTNVGTNAKAVVTGAGNYCGSVTLFFTINQASPPSAGPTGLTAVYGDALNDVALPAEWQWSNPSMPVGDVGTWQFLAIYTPADPNFSSTTVLLQVTVTPKPADKPTVKTGLVHTGSTHIGINNLALLDMAYEHTGGFVDRIAAGSYSAEFTLKPNYMWADGTDGVLTLYWTIGAANGYAEVAMQGFVYGTPAAAPQVVNKTGDWVNERFEYSSDEMTWSAAAPVDAGTYWVRAVLTGSPDPHNFADFTTLPKEYTISPKVLTDELLHVPGTYTYDGSAHRPAANAPGLFEGKDYTVSYANNINAGQAALTITGKGNYIGSLSVNFTINPKSITADMFNAIPDVVYTGQRHTPAVTITSAYTDVTLWTPPDYFHNIDAGTAEITVKGMGNYGGEVTLYFTINKAVPAYTLPSGLTAVYGNTLGAVSLDVWAGWEWSDPADTPVGQAGLQLFKAVFTPSDGNNYETVTRILEITVLRAPVAKPAVIAGLAWNGSPQTGVSFVAGSSAYSLTAGSVSETAKGAYSATFTLTSNYMWADGTTGPWTVQWEIAATAGFAEVTISSFTYGETRAPQVINATGDWNLSGTVYEYSTDGSVWTTDMPENVGAYLVRARLSGGVNYADFVTAPKLYTISHIQITAAMFEDIANVQYTGNPHTPAVVLKQGVALNSATDYTVSYLHNTTAGRASVIISGVGNYGGTVTLNFNITPVIITAAMFEDIAGVQYTGNPHTPSVTLKAAYTDVTFAVAERHNNINAGNATMLVAGNGNYAGTVTLGFTINKAVPAYTAPSNLTAVYGQTLVDVALPSGWAWVSSFQTSVGNAGINSFNAIFTPSNTDNYQTVTIPLNITVAKAPVAKPAAVTGLAWNGKPQTGVSYNDGSPAYAISGDVSATDTGTYNATFTLNANYEWADGTDAPLTVTWEIAAAEPAPINKPDCSWLWFLIGLITGSTIVMLLWFFLFRRKKDEEEDEENNNIKSGGNK